MSQLLYFFLQIVFPELVSQQCHMFDFHVDFLAIANNYCGSVAKAFNTNLLWDWIHYGYHLIHNVVKAGLETLSNHATNTAHHMAYLFQEE